MNPQGTHPSLEPQAVTRDAQPDAIVMVRSEEELVVSHRAVPHERVRVIKRIVTETVTTTTEVRREELAIERVPVEDPAAAPTLDDAPDAPSSSPSTRNRGPLIARIRDRLADLAGRVGSTASSPAGGAFEEHVLELSLMEEHVVVTKRIVPHERVRIRTQIVTTDKPVQATLRQEEIALERTRLPRADEHDFDRDRPADA